MTNDQPTQEEREKNLPSFLSSPDTADKWLIAALFGMAIFSFALIPMRAWLLSHPLMYSLLVGGYTSAVVSGANASVGHGTWMVYLCCAIFGALKFMPIYWWMGKRWGMEFIDMSLEYMPRFKKFFGRALGSRRRVAMGWTLGLLPLGFAPGPVPPNILAAFSGLLKVGVGVVLAIAAASVVLINGTMMWLGFTYGEQVLEVVNLVNKYILWVTLGLVALMIVQAKRRR